MKKMTFSCFIICALALSVYPVNAQFKSPTQNEEEVTDIDGNVYTTVSIGTQTWLLENLKTTRYRNGDVIGTTSTANQNISEEVAPKYQWPWRGLETNVAIHSRHYTWYAATDPRGIAPVGYRVPSDQDFIDLATYLIENGDRYSFDGLKNSGTVDAGNKIAKAVASTYTSWTSNSAVGAVGNDRPANNGSGFSFHPSGYRTFTADPWTFINSGAYAWTSNETLTNPAYAIGRWLFNSSTAFTTRPNGENKKYGMPIRCIKGEAPSSVKNVNNDLLKFQIYPSQVKDYATISFPATLAEKVTLSILSVEGKMVYQNEYLSIGGLDKISVQLSHLNQGIYFCRASSANASSVVKFTKQ